MLRRRRPRLPPGYCKANLPHSDSGSPRIQHQPCAKPAGQVGGSPFWGCRSGDWGDGLGKPRVWGCCLGPGAPPASLGAFPISSLTKLEADRLLGIGESGMGEPQSWISGCLRVSVCVYVQQKSSAFLKKKKKTRGLCSSVSVGPSHLNASDFLPPYHFLFLCSVHRSPWWELRRRRAKRGRRGESQEKQRGCQARGSAQLALHPVLGELAEGKGGQGDP